jgi:hypothetical protein
MSSRSPIADDYLTLIEKPENVHLPVWPRIAYADSKLFGASRQVRHRHSEPVARDHTVPYSRSGTWAGEDGLGIRPRSCASELGASTRRWAIGS